VQGLQRTMPHLQCQIPNRPLQVYECSGREYNISVKWMNFTKLEQGDEVQREIT